MAAAAADDENRELTAWFLKRAADSGDSDRKNQGLRRMMANTFRGTRYQRRWLVFDGYTISYFAEQGGQMKGSVVVEDITDATVAPPPAQGKQERGQPPDAPVLELKIHGRVFKFCPEGGGETARIRAEEWRAAISARVEQREMGFVPPLDDMKINQEEEEARQLGIINVETGVQEKGFRQDPGHLLNQACRQKYLECKALGFDTKEEYDSFRDAGFDFFTKQERQKVLIRQKTLKRQTSITLRDSEVYVPNQEHPAKKEWDEAKRMGFGATPGGENPKEWKPKYEECKLFGFTERAQYETFINSPVYAKCIDLGFTSLTAYSKFVALGFRTKQNFDAFSNAGFDITKAELQAHRNKASFSKGERVVHNGRAATVSYNDASGDHKVRYDDDGDQSGYIKRNDMVALLSVFLEFKECNARGFAKKAQFDAFKASADYEKCKTLGFATKEQFTAFEKMGFDYGDTELAAAAEIEKKDAYETGSRVAHDGKLATVSEGPVLSDGDRYYKVHYDDTSAGTLSRFIQAAMLVDLHPMRAQYEECKGMGFSSKQEFDECKRIMEAGASKADFEAFKYPKESHAYSEFIAFGFTTKAEYDVFRASVAYNDMKVLGFGIDKAGFDQMNSMDFDNKHDFDECRALGIATKDEYEAFKASPEYDEMQRHGFATKAEYDTFKGSSEYDEMQRHGFATKAKYDTFKGSSEYDEMQRHGFATKAEYDTFKGSSEYDEMQRHGFATKAEYDTFKGSSEYDEMQRHGFTTKAEYDTFKESPDFEEMKRLGVTTPAELDAFKASPEYDEMMRLGILTKIEYDTFKESPEYDEMERLGFATKAELDVFKASPEYDEMMRLGLATKIEYDTFKESPEYGELQRLGFTTRAEYETFKASPDFEEMKRLGITTPAEFEAYKAKAASERIEVRRKHSEIGSLGSGYYYQLDRIEVTHGGDGYKAPPASPPEVVALLEERIVGTAIVEERLEEAPTREEFVSSLQEGSRVRAVVKGFQDDTSMWRAAMVTKVDGDVIHVRLDDNDQESGDLAPSDLAPLHEELQHDFVSSLDVHPGNGVGDGTLHAAARSDDGRWFVPAARLRPAPSHEPHLLPTTNLPKQMNAPRKNSQFTGGNPMMAAAASAAKTMEALPEDEEVEFSSELAIGDTVLVDINSEGGGGGGLAVEPERFKGTIIQKTASVNQAWQIGKRVTHVGRRATVLKDSKGWDHQEGDGEKPSLKPQVTSYTIRYEDTGEESAAIKAWALRKESVQEEKIPEFTYMIEYPSETPGARQNANGRFIEDAVDPARLQVVPQEDAVLVQRGTDPVACLALGPVAVVDATLAPGFASVLYETNIEGFDDSTGSYIVRHHGNPQHEDAPFEPSQEASTEIRPSERFSYDVGTALLVLRGGEWSSAVVWVPPDGSGDGAEESAERHWVHFQDGNEGDGRESLAPVAVDLNRANHYPNLFPAGEDVDIEGALNAYVDLLRERFGQVTDSSTDEQLATTDLDVDIRFVAVGASAELRPPVELNGVEDLAKALLLHKQREETGCLPVVNVMLQAAPGTGKTWACLKLLLQIMELEKEEEQDVANWSIPVLVDVKRIEMLSFEDGGLHSGIDLLLQILESEYPSNLLVLRQALAARRLVVILDGLDDATTCKPAVFKLIQTLTSGAHSFLVTSRPGGFADLPGGNSFANAYLCKMNLQPVPARESFL